MPLAPTNFTSHELREIERVKRLLLAPESHSAQAEPAEGEEANFAPLPPMQPQSGAKFGAAAGDGSDRRVDDDLPESLQRQDLPLQETMSPKECADVSLAAISHHRTPDAGAEIDRQGAPDVEPEEENAMQALIQRALTQSKRGRPAAFDDHARGKLVALLALGLSVRQSATVLGVSHSTIVRALAGNPELREEVTAARYQAQLQPLGCVIREAQRSWRAATWLLKYMDGKLASREETPEEKRERIQVERVENEIRFEENQAAREARERARQRELEAQQLAEKRAEIEAMFPRRKRKPQREAPK